MHGRRRSRLRHDVDAAVEVQTQKGRCSMTDEKEVEVKTPRPEEMVENVEPPKDSK